MTTDTSTATAADQGQQGTEAGQQGTQAQGTAEQGAAFGAAATAQGQAQQGTQGQQAQQGNGPDMTGWPQAAIDAYTRRDAQARQYQREAGDSRINAKNQARDEGARKALADFAKASGLEIPGLTDGDADADPAALAAEVANITTERDSQARQAAAFRAALLSLMPGDDNTKADALDFLEFKLGRDTELSSLSPSDADFSAKLAASVQAVVSTDPRFKQSGTATASGVESLGGATSTGAITPESFASMSIDKRTELFRSNRAEYDRLVAAQR